MRRGARVRTLSSAVQCTAVRYGLPLRADNFIADGRACPLALRRAS